MAARGVSRTMIYSPDLVTWTETEPLPIATDSTPFVFSVAYAHRRYYVQYTGTNVATTTDGRTWTTVPELQGTSSLAGDGERLVALISLSGNFFIKSSGDGSSSTWDDGSSSSDGSSSASGSDDSGAVSSTPGASTSAS